MKSKKTISVVIAILLVTIEIIGSLYYSVNVQAAQNKQALNAYKQALNGTKIHLAGNTYDKKNCFFAVVDINHDGVGELFFRPGGGQYIYTYKNNKVVAVKGADGDAFSFLESHMLQYFDKGNILRGGRMVGGWIYEGIYQLSGTQLKSVASSSISEEGAGSSYQLGERKVNKKKYDRYVKKISKKSKYHDIEYHEVSKENINQYL